jgi:hypothetical protein
MAGLDPATQRGASAPLSKTLFGARTRDNWVAASWAAMVIGREQIKPRR